jgi:hypothetical protein
MAPAGSVSLLRFLFDRIYSGIFEQGWDGERPASLASDRVPVQSGGASRS